MSSAFQTTRIYGGLWVTPSIIDKCWTRRWNCTVLEKQTFKSSFLCTDSFALPYLISMMKICSSLFLCPKGLIFSLLNVALLQKYMQTHYFFIAHNPDPVKRLIKCTWILLSIPVCFHIPMHTAMPSHLALPSMTRPDTALSQGQDCFS